MNTLNLFETRWTLLECFISQAKPKAPRKSSRQSGRSSGNITAPTIKQVLTHLNALRQNGDKIKFGFYTPEEEQLEELKEIRDKCKIASF